MKNSKCTFKQRINLSIYQVQRQRAEKIWPQRKVLSDTAKLMIKVKQFYNGSNGARMTALDKASMMWEVRQGI